MSADLLFCIASMADWIASPAWRFSVTVFFFLPPTITTQHRHVLLRCAIYDTQSHIPALSHLLPPNLSARLTHVHVLVQSSTLRARPRPKQVTV